MSQNIQRQLKTCQKEAIQQALEGNTVVVLPTGAGKTLIASHVIYRFCVDCQDQFVVVLCPSKPLLEQQKDVIQADVREFFNSPLRIKCLHGDATQDDELDWSIPETWQSLVLGGSTTPQVLFFTPDSLVRYLVHGMLKLKNVSLMVFDESHNQSGKSPYGNIMHSFYSFEPAATRPRILAMTASPFNVGKIADIEKALETFRTRYHAKLYAGELEDSRKPELLMYQPYDMSPSNKSATKCLSFVFDPVEQLLNCDWNQARLSIRIPNEELSRSINICHRLCVHLKASHPKTTKFERACTTALKEVKTFIVRGRELCSQYGYWAFPFILGKQKAMHLRELLEDPKSKDVEAADRPLASEKYIAHLQLCMNSVIHQLTWNAFESCPALKDYYNLSNKPDNIAADKLLVLEKKLLELLGAKDMAKLVCTHEECGRTHSIKCSICRRDLKLDRSIPHTNHYELQSAVNESCPCKFQAPSGESLDRFQLPEAAFTRGAHSKLKIIVFVKEKQEAMLIHKFLKVRGIGEPGVVYASTAKYGTEKISTTGQRETIDKFRKGGCNIIVSTALLHEGIDVPDCGAVIRTTIPDTICANIQARGRARGAPKYYGILIANGDKSSENKVAGFYTVEEKLVEYVKQQNMSALPTILPETGGFVIDSTGARMPCTGTKQIIVYILSLLIHRKTEIGGVGEEQLLNFMGSKKLDDEAQLLDFMLKGDEIVIPPFKGHRDEALRVRPIRMPLMVNLSKQDMEVLKIVDLVRFLHRESVLNNNLLPPQRNRMTPFARRNLQGYAGEMFDVKRKLCEAFSDSHSSAETPPKVRRSGTSFFLNRQIARIDTWDHEMLDDGIGGFYRQFRCSPDTGMPPPDMTRADT